MALLSDCLRQIELAKSKDGLIKVLEYYLASSMAAAKLEIALDIDYRHFIEHLVVKINSFRPTEADLSESHRHLIQSERLAAMGQVAAAVSHELRNPLTGIKVACDYLMQKMEDKPQNFMSIVKNIQSEANYANSIITNILNFSKISKPEFGPANLRAIIDEALVSVASQGVFQRIEIVKAVGNDLPRFICDAGQIKQVVTNLLINAAEAMPGGGNLKVSAVKENETLSIRVEDTGCGIEHHKLEKIFQPFYSTKIKGIGLGLAIVREIVENHNGKVNVESRVGKGSVFMVKLPFHPETAEKETVVPQKSETAINIMVVDDESIVRETVACILKDEGYSVYTAKDGPSAIDLAGQQALDIIFMDIKLPGIDGVEAFARIKKVQPLAKVVMMTAYPVEDLIQRALDLGASGCLHKPFDMKELIDKVKSIKTIQ